jgi:hypothetical protein
LLLFYPLVGVPVFRHAVSVIQRAILRVLHEQKQGINAQLIHYRPGYEENEHPATVKISIPAAIAR